MKVHLLILFYFVLTAINIICEVVHVFQYTIPFSFYIRETVHFHFDCAHCNDSNSYGSWDGSWRDEKKKNEFIFKLSSRDFFQEWHMHLSIEHKLWKCKTKIIIESKTSGLAGWLVGRQTDGVNGLSTLNVDNEQKQAE